MPGRRSRPIAEKACQCRGRSPSGGLREAKYAIHVTFLLLLAWIGVAQYLQGGASAALDFILFIIAIFACVVSA